MIASSSNKHRTTLLIFIASITNAIVLTKSTIHNGGILYPKASETRQVVSLDGLWNFKVSDADNPLQGFDEHWYKRNLKDVSVCGRIISKSKKKIDFDFANRSTITAKIYTSCRYRPATMTLWRIGGFAIMSVPSTMIVRFSCRKPGTSNGFGCGSGPYRTPPKWYVNSIKTDSNICSNLIVCSGSMVSWWWATKLVIYRFLVKWVTFWNSAKRIVLQFVRTTYYFRIPCRKVMFSSWKRKF